MLNFLKMVSPIRAFHDLRGYLRRKRKHEIVFLAAAFGLTFLIMFGFGIEMKGKPPPYKREIVYFKQWTAARTDAEVKAQQAIDLPSELKRRAEEERYEAEQRAAFQRLGDKMNSMGLY